MYLSEMTIKDLRKLEETRLEFQNGLNLIVGANNIGKSTVVDALRSLLSGPNEYPLAFTENDLRVTGWSTEGKPETQADIMITYTFKGLSLKEQSNFIPALRPTPDGDYEVHITCHHFKGGSTSRLKVKRWCGELDEVPVNTEMLENLRCIYLPPLRDASNGLRPSRASQIARIMLNQATKRDNTKIEALLKQYDEDLAKQDSIKEIQEMVRGQHESMLGNTLSQNLKVGLGVTSFEKFVSRVLIEANRLNIDQNGLGYNNLIYMAVVLGELSSEEDSSYRGLIVEEPEAHLHPQLQYVLLNYLESFNTNTSSENVQIFVTTHSPNFSSSAGINSTLCLFDNKKIKSFKPSYVYKGNEKLQKKVERYLDVTRSELFFADRIIFVEGISEKFLIPKFAEILKLEPSMRRSISVISVEGINFDCFTPLFGKDKIEIPVAIISDNDPTYDEGRETINEMSESAKKLNAIQDPHVKVFLSEITFEYELALPDGNLDTLIEVLIEMGHKTRARRAREIAEKKISNKDKAKEFHEYVFKKGKVSKGRFAQTLLDTLSDNRPFTVPNYIKDAINHVSQR